MVKFDVLYFIYIPSSFTALIFILIYGYLLSLVKPYTWSYAVNLCSRLAGE
jgi:hypothetical protein